MRVEEKSEKERWKERQLKKSDARLKRKSAPRLKYEMLDPEKHKTLCEQYKRYVEDLVLAQGEERQAARAREGGLLGTLPEQVSLLLLLS